MKVGKYQLQLMLLALATALAWTAAAEKPQSPTAAEREVVVMKAGILTKLGPPANASEAIPGSELAFQDTESPVRPMQPTPDLEACQALSVTVEIVDPATARAVVREGARKPRVVRPGSVLAGTTAVVREIGVDMLVAQVEDEDAGSEAVLWIYAGESFGKPSRAQCFVKLTSSEPAARAAVDEPQSHK